MPRLAVLLFLAIYFSSGFAALLYQVVWQRMLAIFSGSDLYATTTIVASFMAGLGIGSLFGGAVADRLSARRQIALFALAELLAGGFALASKWWYYDVLYVRYAHLASSPILLAGVLFGSLLLPTFCMGMSFPLLSKALTPTIELAGKRIGSLYALNTLGAAVGAFAAAWFLMGDQDFPRILRLGARINIAAALLAIGAGYLLRERLGDNAPERTANAENLYGERQNVFSFSTWMLIYALSGFLALSLEIVWFRLLGVMLKSNSFTFPHLLALYLASLAAGTAVGVEVAKFGKRPERIFLGLQSGIVVYAGSAIVGLLWALDHWPAVDWLHKYFAAYEPFDISAAQRAIQNWLSHPGSLATALRDGQPSFLRLYVALPLVIIAPSTFMMGASFPFLQRAVQDSRDRLGRRVGWLQAANIFGATAGTVLVGSLFLHFFGASWTLRLMIALGGVLILLWARLFSGSGARRLGYVAALVLTTLLASLVPPGSVLWARLHGSQPENTIATENGSGVALLKNDAADFSSTTFVYINGLGQSWIPYFHINSVHSRFGIIPLMLHPAPKDIAVIGLGSGDTAYSLGGREETTSITCIEIAEPQLQGLRLLQERRPYGALESLLSDARIKFLFTDGRAYIASNARKYDIVEADALRPNSAFAGNLYSYEYFMLLKSRLKPGGLAVTWAPTQRVVETFVKAFPHVFNFDYILVGSAEPIEFDRDAIRARLENNFTQAYYQRAGIDAKTLVSPYLERKREDLQLNRSDFSPYDVNTDLHPKDEYGR